jgi:hypothetical protein
MSSRGRNSRVHCTLISRYLDLQTPFFETSNDVTHKARDSTLSLPNKLILCKLDSPHTHICCYWLVHKLTMNPSTQLISILWWSFIVQVNRYMFRHVTTVIFRRCSQEEVLTNVSLQFVYTTTLYYIILHYILHYITYIPAGFPHEISCVCVCVQPGYRGHCVPFLRGWGQGGDVVVLWCGGGIVRIWICNCNLLLRATPVDGRSNVPKHVAINLYNKTSS